MHSIGKDRRKEWEVRKDSRLVQYISVFNSYLYEAMEMLPGLECLFSGARLGELGVLTWRGEALG